MKPGNTWVEKPGLSGVSGLFPESPGFTMKTLNHKLYISSIVHLSLSYLFTYLDGASEGPTRD
jgi:hypothetical protein